MTNLILSTPRLHLREMQWADLDFIATMLSDPEVMRFYPHVYSREQAGQWLQRQLQRYEQNGFGLWLVEDKQTGQPIGQVGVLLQEVEDDWLHEVGYLIHRPYWQLGFATEAAQACHHYAFKTLNIERIHSLIRPVNIPSQRTALKTGMKPHRLVQFKGYEHLLFARNSPES